MIVNRMASTLYRVKLRWSGFMGAPGYSIFHFAPNGTGTAEGESQAAAIAVDAWAGNIVGNLPAIGTLQVEPDVEEIQVSNGQMLGVFPVQGLSGHQSSAPSQEAYSGPAGAVVNWRTAGVRNGRRVHGRTFLVPLRGAAFENNGTLSTITQTNLRNESQTLADGAFDGPSLHVYCRPSTKGATDGLSFAVDSASVPDLAAVLRSRRD
jgi:hypothetical protein